MGLHKGESLRDTHESGRVVRGLARNRRYATKTTTTTKYENKYYSIAQLHASHTLTTNAKIAGDRQFRLVVFFYIVTRVCAKVDSEKRKGVIE